MTITLQIDRLVLDGVGVPSHARGALAAAVESELTRLIESGGLHVSHGISVPVLTAPGVTLEPGATPGGMGTQIAGALFSSVSQPVDGPAQAPGTTRR